MSLSRCSYSGRRKTFMKNKDYSANRALVYHDSSDGEIYHDGGESGSSPMCSPEHDSSEMDDNSSAEFLELDLPSPTPSPRLVRRTKRLSPIPFSLDENVEDDFQVSGCVRNGGHLSSPLCSVSPPHRRLKALRLFDTPHTPKSLIQRARRRKIPEEKLKKKSEKLYANINPFTPINNRVQPFGIVPNSTSGKRNRTDMERNILEDSTEDELDEDMPSTKKIALREINTSRYNEEFHEVCKLGDGEFGSVFKCLHRLDGCTYAIKKSKTPVAGSVYERNALNEVYAHAVLGKHPHVVRYYSAWAENDYMYIQNEYCNGGSLGDIVEENKKTKRRFSESDLTQLLFQAVLGLRYIHSQNLVHLDIKPGNIFIHRNPKFLASPESGLESCEEEEEFEEAVLYKIGDLGHVTSAANPVVEEGDCRYLPKELLNDDFDHLTKADIFSLGLTIYEVGGNINLPKNGELWHSIRRGELPALPNYSVEFNALLRSMVCEDPYDRPSAVTLAQHPVLCPQEKKTRIQLRKELNEERFKNQMLSRKLIEATKCLDQFTPTPLNSSNPQYSSGRRNRLIGTKMKRSMSLSAF
ncbi:hypothetical protein ScPMuIL_012618 [Solemya velum]